MKAPAARRSAVGRKTLRSLLVFASAAVNSLSIYILLRKLRGNSMNRTYSGFHMYDE
jgi:hypothetical protein